MPPEPTPAAPTPATPVVPAAPVPNSDTGNAPGSETPMRSAPAGANIDVPPNSGEKLFTQADLDAKITDRLTRERAQAKTAADKAVADAVEARRVENGEFKQLAEDRKATIDTLTPKAELADRLSEIFSRQLETEIGTWPDSVRAIMPAADRPLLERLEWAERTRPLAQELLAAKGGQPLVAPGTRFPAQHPGGGSGVPATTKAVAEATLNKAYAPRKSATQT